MTKPNLTLTDGLKEHGITRAARWADGWTVYVRVRDGLATVEVYGPGFARDNTWTHRDEARATRRFEWLVRRFNRGLGW